MRMSKSIKLSWLLFFLLCTIIIANEYYSNNFNAVYSKYPQSKSNILEFTYPITITFDKNFTDYGFPGTGDKDDPFIIENIIAKSWLIPHAFIIINTTKHFIIRNCNFEVYYSAVYLRNVSHNTAQIYNNTCSNSDAGIAIVESSGVRIFNNTYNENNYGIYVQFSNQTIIENNICTYNNKGIAIAYSSFRNQIINNTCSYNQRYGITDGGTENDWIINNTCIGNRGGGIYLYSESATVLGNNCSNNRKNGIWANKLDESAIKENKLLSNLEHGFLMTAGDNNRFKDNIFENNTKYGLYLEEDTTNNRIHHNFFITNNENGTSQAKDDGSDNTWYDQKTEEGNYWSDWQKNKPYLIDGLAETTDPHPLNENLERIDYNFLFFSITIICLAYLYMRKKH